ncbi:MAG: hemimethylated DNA-binding YccV-like domain-containing protein, partial [Pseudomonadales bacterium]
MALGATTAMNRVRFPLGAIVYHHKQGYRGVIFGVDAEFALSDEWYDRVAQS